MERSKWVMTEWPVYTGAALSTANYPRVMVSFKRDQNWDGPPSRTLKVGWKKRPTAGSMEDIYSRQIEITFYQPVSVWFHKF